MQLLFVYLISIPIFVALDLLWVGVVAKSLYQKHIGHLRGPINWPAAIAFYILYLAGLTFFAIYPAFSGGSLYFATILGGTFSFFAYATYNLTNYATLKNWPLAITLIDMLWGTALGAVVSTLTVLIARSII